MRESLIDISLKAGSLILEFYRNKDFKISEKNGIYDLVTDVDKRSQQLIIDELSSKFPEIPIIGEEDESYSKSEHAFIVDPLDGTLNFVKQVPFFSVSIGYWRENKPICGVVFDPLKQDLFYAQRGMGSYRNGVRINITKNPYAKQYLFATDWGHEPLCYQRNIILTQRLFQEDSFFLRFLGCASLAICYVSAGILDGYWHFKLCPWDMAAGALIAQEAGASVTLISGEKFDLWHNDILVIDPDIKDRMLPLFKNIDD